MATNTVTQIPSSRPSRATLSALKNTYIIDNPAPRDPAAVAAVLIGVRYAEIRTDGERFSAAIHLRLGEWMPVAVGMTEDQAFGAIAMFALRVADVPYCYAEAHDAAEREAAAEVLNAFTAPASIPLAA
jgi:hypothetical protein